jgi:hypothetical protein
MDEEHSDEYMDDTTNTIRTNTRPAQTNLDQRKPKASQTSKKYGAVDINPTKRPLFFQERWVFIAINGV